MVNILKRTLTRQAISRGVHDTALVSSQSTIVKMNDICSYGVSLGIQAVLCKQWAPGKFIQAPLLNRKVCGVCVY